MENKFTLNYLTAQDRPKSVRQINVTTLAEAVADAEDFRVFNLPFRITLVSITEEKVIHRF